MIQVITREWQITKAYIDDIALNSGLIMVGICLTLSNALCMFILTSMYLMQNIVLKK